MNNITKTNNIGWYVGRSECGITINNLEFL